MTAAPASAAEALPEPLRDWLVHLRVERRLAPRTLASYQRNLELYCQHAAVAGHAPLAASGAQLRALLAERFRNGWHGRTLAQFLATLRGAFRWLQRRGVLAHDPTLGLRAPKAAQKLPQVLDPDEAGQLVEVDPAAVLGRRDRALLELFYGLGLRLAELCGLRWAHLDLDSAEARVLGKGSRTRLLPIGRAALAALQDWAAEQRNAGLAGPEQPVFPGRNGSLSPRAVQLRLKTLARRQGLWKNVHPHLLRHSFASHLLESSGELRGVQELLGHADLRTTQVYTHLDFQHLARVYDAAHPRARKR